MYIAMNRFKIKPGLEQDFTEIWKNRDSSLDTVPGFIEFHLFQGDSHDDHTLFSSYAKWESEQAFRDWTKSDAFKKAHSSVGSRRDVFVGPPSLECFDVII